MSSAEPEDQAVAGGGNAAAVDDSANIAGANESSSAANTLQSNGNETNVAQTASPDSDQNQIATLNARRLSAEKAESRMRRIAEAEKEKNSELEEELRSVEAEMQRLREQLVAANIPACTLTEHADLAERLANALDALEKAHRTIAEREDELKEISENASDYGANVRRTSVQPSYLETLMGGDMEKKEEELSKGEGNVIPGSENLKAGGILAKDGTKMGFVASNPYWEAVKKRFDSETESEKEVLDEKAELSLRKQLSGGKWLVESKEDELLELEIPSEDRFEISVFVRKFTTVLKKLGAASIVSKTFGWMDEYAEVVGRADELKT